MAVGVLLLGCVLALGGRIPASQGINEKPCDELFSVAVPDGQVLADNSLLGTNGVIYPPGHYWSVVVNGAIEFIGCPCLANPCFRKCCGAGMALSETEEETCISFEEPFRFVLYDLATSKTLNSDDLNFTLLYGHTCKYGKYLLEPEKSASDQYFLLPDGTLYVPAQENVTMNPTQFCLDMVVNNSQVVPAICFPPDEPDDQQQFILYPVGMLISEPFLLATFLVYALIVELRNLHGLCLMSYLCGLFIAYFFLAIVQLSDEYSSVFCTTMGFIIYYAFLASFFWLNVMCFDIWWTFSGYRPLRGSVKEREFKKFVIYSCYAWGCSLLLLAVCLVIDFAPGVPEHILKPEFGTIKCWLATRKGQLVYFYGPIGVLVITNVLFFTLTAVKIIQLKKETAMLKGRESKRHDEDENNKQRFILYLKLFVVMGVNWSMELVSFAVGGPKYLWYITDICNTLQGVLIFLIFVWKDKIRRLLAKRFCSKLSRTTPSSRMRSTSSKSPSRSFSSTNLTLKTSTSSDIRLTPLVKRSESNGKWAEVSIDPN